MILRRCGLGVVAALLLVGSVSAAGAQYQYYEDEGFYVFLDAVLATPGNTDEVIAVTVDDAGPGETQTQRRILTDWDSNAAGALELGYRWTGGSKVSVSYWSFDADQRAVGDGPPGSTMYFGVGPTIFYQGVYYGTFGNRGHFDMTSKIEASSLRVDAGHRYELSDEFKVEWAVGVRYADFQETLSGAYDYFDSGSAYFGEYAYGASKSNEGEMLGLELGARGTYVFGEMLSVNAGMNFASLNGKVTSRSSLVPIGSLNAGGLPASSFMLEDKDRSGTIRDFDLEVVWHLADDRYRVWLGYQHSTWDGIAADLSRKQAALYGRQLSLATRENVAFSGFKFGVGFLF